MNPGKYDLNLYRGDTYSWRFRLWQDKDRTIPVDLAGSSAEAEIRDKINGSHFVDLDCVITLPNIIDMYLRADMWPCITGAGGVWDLEVTFADGEVKTQVAGKVTVTADVTNSKVPTSSVYAGNSTRR